jgi:hypothetical protein
MPKISFYDAKTRAVYTTDEFTIEKDKRGRSRAVAIAPGGNKVYQYIKEEKMMK